MSNSLAGTVSSLIDAYNQPAIDARRLASKTSLDVVEVYPYVPYIQYLLPGSIVMSIFMMVMIGGGIIFVDDKARGLHEGDLVTPASRTSKAVRGGNESTDRPSGVRTRPLVRERRPKLARSRRSELAS